MNPNGKGRPKLLTKVLAEHKRWETMPNRREPFTKSMLLWVLSQAKGQPFLSLAASIADWCLLALYFGFRLSEFLQTEENIRKGVIQRNIDGLPQAFILSDVQFFGPNKRLLRLDHSCSVVEGFTLRWRYQKNQQNGETKLLTRNDRNPKLCAVRAMLRICHRASCLHNKMDHPLAIFQSTKAVRTLISYKQVEDVIKLATRKVYNLTPRYLQRFSLHSLRVGACVMLHIAGFTADDIKF